MNKRILSIVFAIALSISMLVGCGSDTTETQKPVNDEVGETTSTNHADATQPTFEVTAPQADELTVDTLRSLPEASVSEFTYEMSTNCDGIMIRSYDGTSDVVVSTEESLNDKICVTDHTEIELDEADPMETEPTETEPPEPVLIEKYPTVPLIFQTDYSYSNYGNYGTIASHGCGIASVTMVASYLLDKEFSLHDMAQEYGRYNLDIGSSWSLFTESAKELGLTIEHQTWDINEVAQWLEKGCVAIGNAIKGSPFTNFGHYIVLTGITEDGKILVNDPYKGNYGQYSSKVLKDGFKNGFDKSAFGCFSTFWIYSPKSSDVITNTTPYVSINYEIVENASLSYYVYTPSVVNPEEETPLIVWLHDSLCTGLSERAFANSELPKLMSSWWIDEFNAYVICPQLTDGVRNWTEYETAKKVEGIINEFVSAHNVDTNKIVVMGQGVGGSGALNFIKQYPELCSTAVVFGSEDVSVYGMDQLATSVKCFVGTKGESSGAKNFTKYLAAAFGEENIITVEAAHADVLKEVLMKDEDGNGQSDVLEWAFEQ